MKLLLQINITNIHVQVCMLHKPRLKDFWFVYVKGLVRIIIIFLHLFFLNKEVTSLDRTG